MANWSVVFRVNFHNDMFPGYGHDPMDVVKSLKRELGNNNYVNEVEFEIDWFADKEDVDVDEPDQYNVFEDQDGHNCG